jgi:membrane-bound lytic murein transglycosylase D
VHDSEDLRVVYEVVDLRARFDAGRERQRQQAQEDALRRYQRALERLAQGVGDTARLGGEERRAWVALGRTMAPQRYRDARERLRVQVGQRDRFAAGLAVWDQYRDRFQQILRGYDVPDSLAVLPFVESSFNNRARSTAGAVGLWQITKPAGKHLLRMGRRADERQDPVKATQAAAQILKANHRLLGSWPLAITAYNHGPAGVARGTREVGSTDIAELVARYRGPAFGFASRNFYVEFLAALAVVGQRDVFFAEAAGSADARVVAWTPLEASAAPAAPSHVAAVQADSLVDTLASLRQQVLVFTTVDTTRLGAGHLATLRRAFRIGPDRPVRWFRWGPSLAPPGEASHGAFWYTVWYDQAESEVSETLVVAASGEVLQRVQWPGASGVPR